MNTRTDAIEQRLRQAFSPQQLNIVDDSQAHAGHAGVRENGGGHFNVTIISGVFSGKTLIQRHRLIYSALDDLMKTDIHALSIRALTPEELT